MIRRVAGRSRLFVRQARSIQQAVWQTKDEQLSPVHSRVVPWLDAYRVREDFIRANPEAAHQQFFAHHPVVTRAVGTKHRADAFSYRILPFRDNKWALDEYINANGRLRVGQLFQDLDALSAVIAYKHCAPAEPVIVTASVDRIYMLSRIQDIEHTNISLSGYVSWTGTSSMEITINAAGHTEAIEELKPEHVTAANTFLTANFTFVARDPDTQRSFPINKLEPLGGKEKAEFVRAEHFNRQKKLEAAKAALTVQPPTQLESGLIHDLWLRQMGYAQHPDTCPSYVAHMADTKVYSTSVMQPQYRNMHSYMIFGGYLMRQTFELAYACASAFSGPGSVPRFVTLDSTTFRSPVPVGSVLNLTATVCYTEQTRRTLVEAEEPVDGTLVQVRVDSRVRDMTLDTSEDTGQFTYSYFVPLDHALRKTEVLPRTYGEMMEYLEGRRRAMDTAQFYAARQLEPVE